LGPCPVLVLGLGPWIMVFVPKRSSAIMAMF
jgi:hypothetical protein